MSSALAVALAACAAARHRPRLRAATPQRPTSKSRPLDLTYDTPAVVGATAHATASGLPAGKTVDLTWGTVTGGWVIEDYYHFRGKKYSETTTSLGQFPVDASGRLSARFVIPEDYGGVHEVIALIDGKPVAQNGINVTQTFELTPTSGPVGTPVELKVTGLGWRTMESTWVVNWDNRSSAWCRPPSTRGSAVARFRATGPVGDHIVKLYTGWQGPGYLNYEQSPVADLAAASIHLSHDAGTSVERRRYAEPYQPQPIPPTEVHRPQRRLTLAPTQGPVGHARRAEGRRLRAWQPLRLVWETSVGSRVSGDGFTPQENAIGEVKAGCDGRIERP